MEERVSAAGFCFFIWISRNKWVYCTNNTRKNEGGNVILTVRSLIKYNQPLTLINTCMFFYKFPLICVGKFDSSASSGGFLKVKCGKMLTSSFLLLPNTRGTTRFTFLSLPISFSFSFTLWMVHLAYMTEWIHNPGQFKIPWGPVGIKWNHISRKDCRAAICGSPGFSSFPFSCGWETRPAADPDGWWKRRVSVLFSEW